ncbi:MAG: argininosuccinate lyase [Myxococcaceae bacterium]
MIAKTDAAGGPGLLPEVLAFSSSLEQDRALLREDLVGSLAHLAMLSRQGIVPAEAARAIHDGLVGLWRDAESGVFVPAGEEDVHMAVEAELTRRLGDVAGFLHTGRSRNDQVALDLRLFVRERCADVLTGLAQLLDLLAGRAEADRDVVLPAYTHRQRAQPISAGYWWTAYGAMFARDVEAVRFALGQVDASPLGVGAIAGTSLPTDRRIPQALLDFSRLTLNGLDTVGDRDFALDFVYASSRLLLHASRLATDVVDFTSSEFGFLVLDDAIACGSSLMPQKKNPDVFELVRGRSGQGIGALVQLFTTIKGLPGGYNRDLQEDRAPLLGTAANVLSVLGALRVAIPRIRFDADRCRAALERDYTQATDVAEALVKAGVPFRSAYRRVGTLVRKAQGAGLGLMQAQELAHTLDPELGVALASVGDVRASVAGKRSAGSTGPAEVERQTSALRDVAAEARAAASTIPRLAQLFTTLAEGSR